MLYAENFRAPGFTDKQTLDAAIAAWLASGGTLQLGEARTYDLGSFSTAQNIYEIYGALFSGTLDGNGATIKINTTANVQIRLFSLANYRGLTFRNLRLEDQGFVNTATRGMVGIAPSRGYLGSYGLNLDDVSAYRAVALLQSEGPETGLRVSGIKGSLRAEEVFYPANFQNSGDDVALEVVTVNCGRTYFAYGIRAHRVKLDIFNADSAPVIPVESCIVLKRYEYDVSDVEVDALFRGSIRFSPDAGTTPGACVLLEHQNDSGATSLIDGVRLHVQVEQGTTDPHHIRTFAFRAYTANLTLQTTTDKSWRNVSLSGRPAPGNGPNIAFISKPSGRTVVTLDPNLAIDWSNGEIVAPNVALRTRVGSEFYITTGVLGASPGGLPLASVDVASMATRPLDVIYTAMAYSDRDQITSRSSTFTRALSSGYVDGSGNNHIDTHNILHTEYKGTAAFIGVDTASNDFRVLLYNGGGQYDGSDGLAKVELEWVGQKPADW